MYFIVWLPDTNRARMDVDENGRIITFNTYGEAKTDADSVMEEHGSGGDYSSYKIANFF